MSAHLSLPEKARCHPYPQEESSHILYVPEEKSYKYLVNSTNDNQQLQSVSNQARVLIC